MLKRIESGIFVSTRFLLTDDLMSWVRDAASQLGLKGVVFEKGDGSVKIIAEGEEESLEELKDEVEEADFSSHIENFYMNWGEPKGEFQDFYIEYGAHNYA